MADRLLVREVKHSKVEQINENFPLHTLDPFSNQSRVMTLLNANYGQCYLATNFLIVTL